MVTQMYANYLALGDLDGLYRTTSSTIEWVCGSHGSYTKNKLLVQGVTSVCSASHSLGASHLLWCAVQSFLHQGGPAVVATLVTAFDWRGSENPEPHQHVLDLMKLLQLCFHPTFNRCLTRLIDGELTTLQQ